MTIGEDRRGRILGLLLGEKNTDIRTKDICMVAAEVVSTTGAGVMLMSGDIPRGSLCSTDRVSALIEELQYELGEGPCIDAYETDQPVVEPDLVDPVNPRWLAFREPAIAAGAVRCLAFRCRLGRFGSVRSISIERRPVR